MFPFLIAPFIPTNNMKPPTVYALLNSMLNFDNDTPVAIENLPSVGASKVFNFDYPLTNKLDKNKFETMILQHFLMRRIGYDTYTAWHIALNVKMNSIMPFYNKLFDAVEGWELFNDGENVTRTQNDNKTTKTVSNSENTGNNTITDTNIQDLRYSNMPQNQITDTQNGTYLTNYNYNTSNGTSSTTTNNTQNDSVDVNEDGSINETINRTPSDKITILKEFMQNTQSIYNMLFKELDCLFYGLD